MKKLGLAVLMAALLVPCAAFAGAMQDAQLISKGQCGRDRSGQSYYVHNSNKRRAVKIVLNKVSCVKGSKMCDYQITRVIPAGGDTEAGCSREKRADDFVESNFKIIAATYN